MKKILVVLILVLLSFYIVYEMARAFSPGLYPNAEMYEINLKDSTLISKIQKFKMSNSVFEVPNKIGLTDGYFGEHKERFGFYFYLKNENKTIFIWVRALTLSQAQLAFVSVNEGVELGNWKELNNDYDFFETRKERERFENLVLKRLDITYSRKSFF